MLKFDMPMPENCFECYFHCAGQFCDGLGYCSAVPPYSDYDCRPCEEKRPDWCPIKGELVTCGECKYRDPEDKKCDNGWMFFSFPRPDDGHCEHGERKEQTDETD